MKIGIVSDIHGYLKPLKAAISLFESHKANQIICAGDLVDGGLSGDAVIDHIRSHNIISVQGNHDQEAFSDHSWIDEQLCDAEESMSDDFDDLLSSYRAKFVSALPLTRTFDWEGLRICLAHGAPWSNTEHIFSSVAPDVCRKIFEATEADIVVLGHTHIPMKLQLDDKWILNAGALCGNRTDLKRTCGILTLPQIQFEVFDIKTKKALELETTKIDIHS